MLPATQTNPTAILVLRIATAITCLGTVARWLPYDSPLFGFLYYDHGLLGESTAAGLDDAVLVMLALAGLLVLSAWMRLGAALASAILLVLALAATATATRNAQYVLLEEATRFLAPLALCLPTRRGASGAVLTIAVSATFLGHGLAALSLNPHFIDLLIGSARRVFGATLPQNAAEQTLIVIGVVDIACVAALLSTRARAVAVWMTCWGLITALSRMTYGGLAQWPETALRALNAAAPLAIVMLAGHRVTKGRPLRNASAIAGFAGLLLMVSCSAGEAALPCDLRIREPGPTQWRVVWTEDPAHSALVAWSTSGAGQTHHVLLGEQALTATTEAGARVVVADRNGPYTRRNDDDGPALSYHHAHLTGLSPSTTYWFVIESDGLRSPQFHFTTAPVDDRPFVLLAGSDSRSDRAMRRRMDERVRALAEADPQVLALLHGGDYVYDGTDFGLFCEWLTDQSMLVTSDGRILPLIPTRGNHEGKGKLFDESFGWPGGGIDRNYFACRLAGDVLLMVLNTEVSTAGDQARFLAETLGAHRDLRWQIASYHQPAWPSVKQPSSALIDFVPVFEGHDLDLAVESDGHTLKRTVPIRGGKRDDTGVVYIGEGGLGVAQRTPDVKRWFLEAPGFARSAHHVWVLHFDKDALRMQAVLTDGTVADDTSLRPRDRRR
ncbi:MAG: fibronectin type III domain-containing protein [Planctomycetota bacterium]